MTTDLFPESVIAMQLRDPLLAWRRDIRGEKSRPIQSCKAVRLVFIRIDKLQAVEPAMVDALSWIKASMASSTKGVFEVENLRAKNMPRFENPVTVNQSPSSRLRR